MTENESQRDEPRAQAEYEAPRLSVLGSVEDLTRGNTGSMPDGASFTPGRHDTPGGP